MQDGTLLKSYNHGDDDDDDDGSISKISITCLCRVVAAT